MSNNNRKPPINVTKFCYWPMLDEETNTFGAARDFGKTLMNYRDSQNTASARLSGCGTVVDSATKIKDGALTYGVHSLNAEDRGYFFGETVSGNVSVTKGTETIPFVACAHAEERRNGHWNLYKYFKAQFNPNEIGTEQVTDGSMTFSTTTLTGTYVRNDDMDMMRAMYLDVDPSTESGAAIIANWFTDVAYVGGTGMVNTSTVKKGTTVINNGDSAAEGDDFTFNGSVTGGTSPYTYSFYYKAAGSDSWTAKQEDSATATASLTLSVASDTEYCFKLVAKDANGITLTRTVTATITNS